MVVAKIKKFIDDKHVHIEDDIKKIQKKPGMYIGNKGERGAFHLSREIANNNIDEGINSASPCDHITFVLDKTKNELMSSDNGRGIPFDMAETLTTKLQSSSKMDRTGHGGASAGENGVGMKATNALSEYFELISRREGKRLTLLFKEGVKVKEEIVDHDPNDHGTTITFKPSEKYLKSYASTVDIPADQFYDWLEMLSYLIPKHLTIEYVVLDAPPTKPVKTLFRNKNGQKDFIKKLVDKPLLDPVIVKERITYKELDPEDSSKEIDRFMELEAAITFSSETNELKVASFCNFVNTIDGGTHVDAVLRAITRYLLNQTKKSLSEKEAKSVNIIPADIYASLIVSFSVLTDSNPDFSGQVKEKVNSEIFRTFLNNMTYVPLAEYFKKDAKALKRVTDLIKINAKARLKASEEKESQIKGKKIDVNSLHGNARFIKGTTRHKSQYSEILVVEGDSAGTPIEEEGFDFQDAIFLKGMSINPFKHKPVKVLSNSEIRTLVEACQAGVGKDFKLEDFYYDKVIIMTDGDSDGKAISSSLCAFLLMYMRPLVEAGRVFRALPPLYKLKDNKRKYVLNKKEFFDVFLDRIGNNLTIHIDGRKLKPKEFRDYLMENRDYLAELQRLAKYFGSHYELVEFMAYYVDNVASQEEHDDLFKKDGTCRIKRFSEMKLIDGVFKGVYEGKYQIIPVNRRFAKATEELRTIMALPCNKGSVTVQKHVGNKTEDLGKMTTGRLMVLCEDYRPIIDKRYKGLGELNAEELRDTTLDPNNRLLIQLTVSDMEKTIEQMRVLHGEDNGDRALRKELISSYKIRRDELDN